MERIVAIDRVGRLVIPKELRVRHGLQEGTRMRIAEDAGHLILEPIPEDTPLVERGGLLLVDAPLSGEPVDHRSLREERLTALAGSAE